MYYVLLLLLITECQQVTDVQLKDQKIKQQYV